MRVHARFEAEHRLSEKRRRAERKFKERFGQRQKLVPGRGKQERLIAPARFSLAENYDEVVDFFESFRIAALRQGKAVYVDLNEIKHISPAATLMLAAELDRWRKLKDIKLRIRDIKTMQPNVLRSLAQVGFFNILQTMNLPRLDGGPGEPRIIRCVSGNRSDLQMASKVSEDLTEISDGELAVSELALNDAIVEAMTNAVHHAYPEDMGGTEVEWLPGQWWVSGSWAPEGRKLNVLIYDQGVGIPATLPRSHLWERARGKLAKLLGSDSILSDHARLIEAAVKEGRSSMSTDGRGLGLAEIADLVLADPQGRLRIISGCGEIIFNSGQPAQYINHTRPLGGTLIQISLTLSQQSSGKS